MKQTLETEAFRLKKEFERSFKTGVLECACANNKNNTLLTRGYFLHNLTQISILEQLVGALQTKYIC
jgi:hypothetical protein